jgi:tetratricopeptide (TPR) repeat protein
VNAYQDTTFRSLQFAETDARAFAQWLVHTRGGNWNPADVQVVLGANATRELVETLLVQLCLNMATAEDMILLYFAGYAFIDQVSGDGYLACSNTRYQQSGSGLHLLSFVSQLLAHSAAAQILCILDCCQFGSIWQNRRGSQFDYRPLFGPTVQNGLQHMQGRLFYCSCRGNETVPETSEKNLGSFMYRMIMAVGGPAFDPATGQITLQRLHAFLFEQLGEQHRPQVFGQEPRPLVLVGELPVFNTGALNSTDGHQNVSSASPAGQPARQTGPMADSSVAQPSPSASDLGQATLATMARNRLQQCQQMLSQARQLILTQNFEQAYQLTETILQIHPTFLDALVLKGQILGAIGRFQDALDAVQQVIELDTNNPLGWSMAAALLANTGQLSEAMTAADRSLSLDPSNSETISIKEMIREKLAERDADTGKRSRLLPPRKKVRDTGKTFFVAAGLQLLALVLGSAGSFLPLLAPGIPRPVAFVLQSISLATLMVNAWYGACSYGFKRLLIPSIFALLALGLLAALTSGLLSPRLAIQPVYTFLLTHVTTSQLMTPLVLMIFWLAAAILLPLLAGLAGLLTGLLVRARRKTR